MTRFYLVDVFADRPLTGNPLALVPDADELTVPQMQAIAREFNQSETTFLLRPGEEGVDWRLRSFTPAGVEVDGAGHNALGAWLWLADQGLRGEGPSVTMHQRLGTEVLPVEILRVPGEPVRVVMDQGTPWFGKQVTDGERLTAALGLEPRHLSPGAVAQVVGTGTGHLLVPLVTREAVDAAVSHDRELAAILAEAGGEGCYLYTTEGDEAAYTRFFNPTVGIAEDPATGTAAGPLAVSLVRSGRAPVDEPVILEQGRRLGRPSRIRVDVAGDRVRISGSGVITAHGELHLTPS
ncbi:epimerase [Actinoplanes cyaneus]|uniref:Epimerase n=1 Tax=Actinoplanes cyaneus TaxID=52696 RepID=A0A919IDD1_9ACTN|nr:PhzF family phenazine biosynthesis protein [Actinoplanes cyaneus]MCW2143584.1 phenazine biosynthesis protein PhzF family [Actinoplanes cyaneus]GID62327.1 epimerase [Actinoplanes cyaneus]